MNDLEDRVITTLRDQADRSGTFTGMERTAIPRARRLRLRRRVTAGAAGMAVLAMLGPAVWNGLPELGVDTMRPTSQPVHEIELDVTTLPKGPAPEVPWFDDGVIHDGDKRIPLRTEQKDVHGLAPLGAGYVVSFRPEGWDAVWVGPDGRKKRAVPSLPVVSADGRWAVFYREAENKAILEVLDVETERIVGRRDEAWQTVPRGFVGDRLVFADDTGSNGAPTGTWDLGTGQVRYFDDLNARGVGEAGFLAVTEQNWWRMFLNLPECSAMYDRSGAALWRTCEDVGERMSADGQYVFGVVPDGTYNTSVVRDAVDGRVVYEISGTEIDYGRATAEPDGSILVVASIDNELGNPTREALVRCEPDGTCERVSDIERRTPPDADRAAGTPVTVSGGAWG